MIPPSCPGRRGFTLLELLVVVALLAVLIGMLLPAIQKIRESAHGLTCRNNLKQIGLAAHLFHEAQERMPPAFDFVPDAHLYGGAGLGPLSYHLLAFIEQNALYQMSRHRPPSNPPQDYFLYTAANVHQQTVKLYNCPSDPTLPSSGVNPTTLYAPSSYAGNYLVFGAVDADYRSLHSSGRPRLASSFPDGLGHTILFAEKYAIAGIRAEDNNGRAVQGGSHWAYFQSDCNSAFFAYYYPGSSGTDPHSVGPRNADDPRNSRFQVRPPANRCNPCLAATAHSAMNVCLADGSVRRLGAAMDKHTWWASVTPAGGEATE